MFSILVVDDNPGDLYLLREMLRTPSHPCHIECVRDGAEALDLLNRRRLAHARLPNLILLDVNMPRLDGVEALAAIKADPELRIIPVIMLSTFVLPTPVRRSYQAYANAFVQKPTRIEDWERLVKAIRGFWMDFAVYAARDGSGAWDVRWNLSSILEAFRENLGNMSARNVGPSLAAVTPEASSGAMNTDGELAGDPETSQGGICPKYRQLLNEFGAAVQELLRLHEQQFMATVQGDSESNRFDLLIHMANEKKQQAKYAYLRHVESHGCSDWNAIEPSRT